jgi:hypothetical protein
LSIAWGDGGLHYHGENRKETTFTLTDYSTTTTSVAVSGCPTDATSGSTSHTTSGTTSDTTSGATSGNAVTSSEKGSSGSNVEFSFLFALITAFLIL